MIAGTPLPPGASSGFSSILAKRSSPGLAIELSGAGAEADTSEEEAAVHWPS